MNGMRHLHVLPVLLLLVCLGPACSKHKPGSPTDGQVVGGIYTNRYFRFTVGIPGGWSVSQLTTALPSGSASNPPKASREVTAHQLLMVSQKPPGTPATTNPSLLIMAEKTSSVPGVKNAKDYIARVSQLMTDSPIAYRPVNGIADLRLGGAPAVRLDFSAQLGRQKTGYQAYLVCQREDHVLSFILSGPTEKEVKRLEAVLQTVKFY